MPDRGPSWARANRRCTDDAGGPALPVSCLDARPAADAQGPVGGSRAVQVPQVRGSRRRWPVPLRPPLEAQERILLAAAVADLREELLRQRLLLEAVIRALVRRGLWDAAADPATPAAGGDPDPAPPGSARAVAQDPVP